MLTCKQISASATIVSSAYQAVMKKQKAEGNIDVFGTRIAYQKHRGVSQEALSALTHEEAYNEVSKLKNHPNLQTQLEAYLGYMNGVKPANRPYVARDLQKAGLSLGSQYLLRASHDREASQYTTDAAKAWDPIQMVKGKEDYNAAFKIYESTMATKGLGSISKIRQGIESNSDYTKYANVILSSGGDTTKRMDDYRNHYELLTLQLMAKGSTEDAAVKTASMVMNAGTAINSYKGSHYMYDKNLKSDTVDGACNALEENYKKSGDFQVPARYKADLWGVNDSTIKDHFINNVSFINTADQSGLTMVWGVHHNPVLDKSGNRITFSFKELLDSSSSLSKQVLLNASSEHQQNVLLQKELQRKGLTEHDKATLKYYASVGLLS